MDNAAFEAEINEHIQRLQDLNKKMKEISDKIGALQEEGRALHGVALEVKGAIEALAKMKAKQDEKLAKSKTASLILPEGVKPVLPEETPAHLAENANEVPTPHVSTEEAVPVTDAIKLEVQ